MALMVYASAKPFSLPTLVAAQSCFRARKPARVMRSTSSHMAEGSSSKLKEFPHLSSSQRALMADLINAIEDRFEDRLLPCTLPPDVEYYQNQSGTSEGALLIRSGSPDSSVFLSISFLKDFVGLICFRVSIFGRFCILGVWFEFLERWCGKFR